MDALTIVAIVAYLLLTCFLGYLGYRQTKTAADYLVAGRSASPLVMALSYGATFISTSAIVGFGGVAANLGMGLLWLTFLNIFVGIFIAFVCLGGPTRRMGHHLDAHTFPELIGRRYNSRFLQVFSALIIFVFMPLYAMAVMVGAAEFIAPTFGVSFNIALLIFALVVVAYVLAGGLKGVMLTDALQGGIMLLGMIILVISTYAKLGGVTAAHQALTDMSGQVPAGLQTSGHQGWTSMPAFGWAAAGAPSKQFNLWWTMVTTIVMGVGIGVLAQPQLIVRFMTVKSKQSLNRAALSGGIFILFMTGVAFVVGALSNVYFSQKEEIACRIVSENVLMAPDPARGGKFSPLPEDAPAEVKAKATRFVTYRLPADDPMSEPRAVLWTPGTKIARAAQADAMDTIEPHLIAVDRTKSADTPAGGNTDKIIPLYVGSAMPHWFGVIFLLTLLAAAMSTMSSQFHTMGTAIGRDVFEQVAKTGPRSSVLITRIGIIVGLVVSLVVGRMVRGNIIALATAIFFGLCAASFLPAFVLGLFWRRMNRAAAIWSMVVGFASSMFWLVFINAKTAGGLGISKALFNKDTLVPGGWSVTWNVVDPLVIAVPLAFLVAVVVALITKPMPAEHTAYVFGGPKPSGK